MLQSCGVADGRLIKQFLKFPAVVKRSLHIGYEFVRNIYGESFSLHSDIQEMAGVFLPFQAGFAMPTDAGAPTQTQRAQSSRPEIRGLIPEPLFNVCGRFFLGWHVVCMPYSLRNVKIFLTNAVEAVIYEFRDRN